MLATSQNPQIEYLRALTERLDESSKIRLDSADYMAAFVDNLPLPAWIKDVEGTMRFLNDAYEKVYDIKKEDYIGKKDSDVWPKDVADNFKRLDEVVLRGESVEYSVEKVINRAEFRRYDHIQVVKFPLFNGPDVVGIAGLVTGVFP